MGKVKLQWNPGALEQVRRMPAVKGLLEGAAERIAAGCEETAKEPGGYTAVTGEGRNRSRAAVVTTTPYAMGHNAKHNTLLRNVDKGRI